MAAAGDEIRRIYGHCDVVIWIAFWIFIILGDEGKESVIEAKHFGGKTMVVEKR